MVILNFTPVPRYDYRIGVPGVGEYQEVLNSDATLYGGTDIGNMGAAQTDEIEFHGHRSSLSLSLPPLGLTILKHAGVGATASEPADGTFAEFAG